MKLRLISVRLNGVCPNYMPELLKQNINIHSTERQSTYGCLNLICPKYKRESEGARPFQVSATTFRNSLPNEIKCSCMVGHLFQNYDTIYVRFFPTYTCNHPCYTIYVRFFVTYNNGFVGIRGLSLERLCTLFH